MQPHQNPYAQPPAPGQQAQQPSHGGGYPSPPAPPVPTPGQPVPGAWPQAGVQPQPGAQPQPGQAWPAGQPVPAPGQPYSPPSSPAQPQYAQPQHAQPQYAQPQYAQPQYAQPQYAQPQAAPPNAAPAPSGYPQPGQAPAGQAARPQSAHAAPVAAAGYGQQTYDEPDDPNAMASEVSVAARAKFIERTYLHLAFAIIVFVVLSAAAQMVPGVEVLVGKMIGHRYSWGVVLALFMGAGYVADKWASGDSSKGMQYAGLMLYTLAEVVIFIPMIYLVKSYVGVQPILAAGAATLAVFAGLTAYVLITKKDFSFMKGTLTTIAMASLGLIVASIVWGFSLGMVFSAAMIVLGAGYILYYTSNVQQHYRTDQHVAAALALFSALAFVFWYVLRIVLSMARN